MNRIVAGKELEGEIEQQGDWPAEQEQNLPVTVASPLDVSIEVFSEALQRRGANRTALMEWVRESLVKGVDFYELQIGGRKAKPSLAKPGAEKVCGMLGLRVTFPTLPQYEQAAIEGRDIENIILRCHLLDAQGNIVADGIGARNVSKEGGDINKAFKMAEKSAHIDATLRCAGLSEVFTQDIEDMTPETPNTPDTSNPSSIVLGFGKWSGETLGFVAQKDLGYLKWLMQNSREQWLKEAAATVCLAHQEELTDTQISDGLQDADSVEELKGLWRLLTKEQQDAHESMFADYRAKLEENLPKRTPENARG